ncbi:type II keratin [Anopheles darlingi]|uniref:Type II keratin n=1 Tax=Anopheles darlingi TaxID=43151 RepID=W5JB71_ANODA|nr:spindle assembly abnormal protein 6 homolog [Anopheles darlingi]ETN60009.1 type II keratin [Anopheles darlingi]
MDSYFINDQRRQFVKVLFPSVSLHVGVENGGMRSLELFDVVVEKMETQNLMQIRMTQSNDHSKMFLSTIDTSAYEEIRVQQALHVTFHGFTDHLIQILESCKKDELHISLVINNSRCTMQIYEKSSFKNLTHLFLTMDSASTEAVLYHLNQQLQKLYAQITGSSSQVNKYQLEIRLKDETIEQLRNEICSLNGKFANQENLLFTRNAEEITSLHQSLKRLGESKELEEKRLKAIINSMQEKIDQLSKESADRAEQIILETTRYENIREENVKLRSLNTLIKEEIDRTKKELCLKQDRESKSGNMISEMKRQIQDMQNKAKLLEKQRSELEAELQAEKNICHTKKHALQISTDELANASVVISNLNKEIAVLKSKVDLRTAIAMRQEKIIQDNKVELKELKETVAAIQQEHLRNRATNEEYAQTVKRINEASNMIEEKYRKKINDMLMKLSDSHVYAVSMEGN